MVQSEDCYTDLNVFCGATLFPKVDIIPFKQFNFIMFDPNNLFNSILLIPILNILIGLYKLLLVLRIPGALGFSLIMLTVIIRIILYPLTMTQLKSTHKLAKLKPLLDKALGSSESIGDKLMKVFKK